VGAPERALGLFIPSALGVRTHTVVGKVGTGGSAARCSAAHVAAWSILRWGRATACRRAERTMMGMGERSPQTESKLVEHGQEVAGKYSRRRSQPQNKQTTVDPRSRSIGEMGRKRRKVRGL
jgi:hypothetical protein